MNGENENMPRPEDRLSLGTKVSAGVGESVINLGINMPKNFGFVVYNLVLGVDAVLLGIVLAIPRLWDGLIDPIMGSLSDNTRGRWGRRKPYMLVGGIASAIGMALICVPPTFIASWFSDETMHGFEVPWFGESIGVFFSSLEWMAALYFVLVSLTFYTFLTVFSVPYGALTLELTGDHHERTRLMSFRTAFTFISGILLAWMLYATKAQWFVDLAERGGAQDPVKTGEVYGTWAVGGFMAVCILVAAMVPTLLVKETFKTQRHTQEKSPVLKSLGQTLRLPAFVCIIAAYTLLFFGFIMVIHLGQYISIYYVHGGDRKDGYLAMSYAQTFTPFVGLLTVFVINRLSGRVEKKIAWAGCMAVSLVGAVLTWFLFSPERSAFRQDLTLPLLGTIDLYLHPLCIAAVLLVPGPGATLVLSYSMIADVCDIDEMKTGNRREGMFWAVFNWIQKSALSVSLLFTGVSLWAAGFDEDAAVQTPETMLSMRRWFTFTMIGTFAAAIVLVLLIPLSQKRMEDVRAQLKARHERLSGPEGPVRGG